ncbi:MAG TPA: ornithine cyclodeaminase family protein [Pseudolabrys sp.]|nr:ornithine cyclodeaminase family protein [Pseudolabrys sp.]
MLPFAGPAVPGRCEPLYLNADEVRRILTPDLVFDVVEQTLQSLAVGRVVNGSKGSLSLDDSDGRRFMGAISGAVLDQTVMGVKWFATCDDNASRGLPRVPATILVCDSLTGSLQGIVEATSLTAMRTAALAAVSVKYCRAAQTGKAAIIGFGAIGKAVAHFLATTTNVTSIAVSGRNLGKTIADCAMVGQSLDIPVVAAASVQSAVQDADIIVTASGLTEDAPFLCGHWVKPGVTVCALSSYQEIDGVLVDRADRVFVDNWDACQHRGNLAPFVRAGRISRRDIVCEIADVAAGRQQGRVSPEEIVLIVLIGLGALDIALAAQALHVAWQRGLGQPLRQ